MDICVGRSRSCTCQERQAKDMLTLTCWRAKYGETVQRIFTSQFATSCIYLFFLCDAGIKKLCVSLSYHVLLVNAANNIQYMIALRYPDKILLKVNHYLLKYCTLHKTHFALQYWQPHFFRGHCYQEYWFIFQICWHLNMLT